MNKKGRQEEEEKIKAVCHAGYMFKPHAVVSRLSRGTDDFRMGHQQLKDLLTLLSSHQLAVSDAYDVYMCWHDACTCNNWASQWSTTSFINS